MAGLTLHHFGTGGSATARASTSGCLRGVRAGGAAAGRARRDGGCHHSAASTSEGELLTWGGGEDGQLGHGEADDQTMPMELGREVFGGLAVTMVSCGDGSDGGGEALHICVWSQRPAGAQRHE
jgi:hypothetical protein